MCTRRFLRKVILEELDDKLDEYAQKAGISRNLMLESFMDCFKSSIEFDNKLKEEGIRRQFINTDFGDDWVSRVYRRIFNV